MKNKKTNINIKLNNSQIGSDCKQIESTYIYIRFVNQSCNRFGSNLGIWIKNLNLYPTKQIEFGYKFDPLTSIVLNPLPGVFALNKDPKPFGQGQLVGFFVPSNF